MIYPMTIIGFLNKGMTTSLLYYLNKTNPEFVYRQNSLKALENQVVEIISYLSEVKSTTEIDNLLYRNESTVKNNQ